MLAAAIVLQVRTRSHMARGLLCRLRQASLLAQTLVRRAMHRVPFIQQRQAAIVLQTNLRLLPSPPPPLHPINPCLQETRVDHCLPRRQDRFHPNPNEHPTPLILIMPPPSHPPPLTPLLSFPHYICDTLTVIRSAQKKGSAMVARL